MHCKVGFAIFVNVAPISDRFAGGTQSVSIVGTPVSLMPRRRASRRSPSSTAAAAWSCRQPHTLSGCAQRPIIWGAHSLTNSARGSGSLVGSRTWACAALPIITQATTATAPGGKSTSLLPEIFIAGRSSPLAGCNKYALRGQSADRRAIIGKRADARHAAVGRAGHRWPDQHESESKNHAEGSHLAVSGLGCWRFHRFSLWS